MKPRTSRFAIYLSVGALALTSGCASLRNRDTSPGAYKPVGGKTLEVTELRESVKATRLALNRTTDSLNRIPGSPAPQQAYEAFRASLNDFDKTSDRMLKQSEDVRKRGRELFAEWSAETESIQDPQIRAVAEERRRKMREAYNTMLTPFMTARTDLNVVRSNLHDLQKGLALDLTPDGINAHREPIDRITREGATSVRSLDAYAAQLERITDALPQATVQSIR